MINKWLLAAVWCALSTALYAQISLKNASFEGEPQDATTPVSWHPCAPDSTPDILPGVWGVHNEPSEGDTYVGLITRRNGTFESIGQRVSQPLRKGNCYTFTIDLAHSRTYAGYNQPLKLRVYAGSRKCRKTQLIGETDFVKDEDFTTYTFEIVPEETLFYLILEAHYTEGSDFSYQGNILLDNISAIKPCVRASLP